MSDYEPDYVYMIPLGYKSREQYYENITTVPARIRGAFIVDEEQRDQIDFEVLNSRNEVVYFNTSNECIFDFTAIEPGRYKLIFNNRYVNSEIKVTFTMNTSQNPILKKQDLSISEQKLDNLIGFIKRFNLEFKLSRNVHQERYKSKILPDNL